MIQLGPDVVNNMKIIKLKITAVALSLKFKLDVSSYPLQPSDVFFS